MEALTLARQAREIATTDSLGDSRSATVGDARLVEARALLASGDSAGGRKAAVQAVTALRYGAGADYPASRESEALVASLGLERP
ncbi:MAG: hypothetical protein ABJD11_11875 [Gemmatimonadota bacterium]